jgi:hypothetical protein
MMFEIEKCVVPANALLAAYSMDGNYVDCYTTDVSGQISLAEFIFAFYTTSIFKLERFILQWTVNKPSTDVEARQLADHTAERFAAWNVENRHENEILMCDFVKRTRSWLMVVPDGSRTRLYFGSAVVPAKNSTREKPTLEFRFRALLGFHTIYSVMLLYFAARRLRRQMKKENI